MDSVYNRADVYAPVANSDHCIVCCYPSTYINKSDEIITYRKRLIDDNRKSLFASALDKVNWSPLYRLNDVNSKLNLLQSTVTAYLMNTSLLWLVTDSVAIDHGCQTHLKTLLDDGSWLTTKATWSCTDVCAMKLISSARPSRSSFTRATSINSRNQTPGSGGLIPSDWWDWKNPNQMTNSIA